VVLLIVLDIPNKIKELPISLQNHIKDQSMLQKMDGKIILVDNNLKQQKELILKNTCFICGLNRSAFDNRTVSFEEHIKTEHNMWQYLYFMVLIRVKDPTEFTGPESYEHGMVKAMILDWFPRLRATSLDTAEGEGDQLDVKSLQTQLEKTQELVGHLSKQLMELKDQMTEQRKQKQRFGLLNPAASASYQFGNQFM